MHAHEGDPALSDGRASGTRSAGTCVTPVGRCLGSAAVGHCPGSAAVCVTASSPGVLGPHRPVAGAGTAPLHQLATWTRPERPVKCPPGDTPPSSPTLDPARSPAASQGKVGTPLCPLGLCQSPELSILGSSEQDTESVPQMRISPKMLPRSWKRGQRSVCLAHTGERKLEPS